jgi:hypothetical protein
MCCKLCGARFCKSRQACGRVNQLQSCDVLHAPDPAGLLIRLRHAVRCASCTSLMTLGRLPMGTIDANAQTGQLLCTFPSSASPTNSESLHSLLVLKKRLRGAHQRLQGPALPLGGPRLSPAVQPARKKLGPACWGWSPLGW